MDIQKILDLNIGSNMMRQYLETKQQYEDAVLFYRLGDFYEFFFDDAMEMSKVLDLTLTGKDWGTDERAPMCGIPFHAAEAYVNKLIGLGYKVAICEQMTDPKDKKSSKDIVKRDVVRIVTPGTVIDEGLIDEKYNNYIACIVESNGVIGFSYMDISTGEFKATEFFGTEKLKKLNDALVKIMPSEILCKSEENLEEKLQICKLNIIPAFSKSGFEIYGSEVADEILCKQFGEDYKDGFNLRKSKVALLSCAVLFNYVKETQKRDLSHINTISRFDSDKYMMLDLVTRRNLELMETYKDRKRQGSLFGVMDKTKTSMGARLLRNWIEQPLYDSKEINARLDGVEELCGKIILRDNLTELLKKCNDIERISGRISYGNLTPKDCVALNNTLMLLPKFKEYLSASKTDMLANIFAEIKEFGDIVGLLSSAIVDEPPALLTNGGIIRDGFNSELDEYRSAFLSGREWILKYEEQEKLNTGIKNLKVGFNRVFGYYIEINKSLIKDVPLNYIRKQTVANNERYITEELKALEDKLLNAEDNAIKLEQKLFNEIKKVLENRVKDMQETARALATLDCLLSLSVLATKNNYTKPKINNKVDVINIIDGRHPVVEEMLKKEQFIPNSTFLNVDDSRTMIITGPNMAGKSTYMRQVALITLMAHIGSFVPAKSAEIALTDRIFTRVGASDDLSQGDSTFMVEMKEVSEILNNATNNSLIILDEIGRGTSTFDGLSIAWAVVEYLSKNMNAKTLFSTHYHELTELENFLPGVKNYRISVKEFNNTVVYLRKIVRGGASKSFGIAVAALTDMPKEVIVRAKEISDVLEQNNNTRENVINSVNAPVSAQQKDVSYTEIVGILKDIDINTMSPISAFEILCDLVNKAKR